ncbi:hypothetical protein DMUE_4783 [Dictyocoela muelleri]|nr:hypothetical protein DMUE_4783 [Dictyocoela muelleri]
MKPLELQVKIESLNYFQIIQYLFENKYLIKEYFCNYCKRSCFFCEFIYKVLILTHSDALIPRTIIIKNIQVFEKLFFRKLEFILQINFQDYFILHSKKPTRMHYKLYVTQ